MTVGSSHLVGFAHSSGWLRALQAAGLVVWLAIPAVGLLTQSQAGRIVWTVILVWLPLLIVLIGYHRWRTICPLAWLNQLPGHLRQASTRRMPRWLERHYYYVPLVIFTACLWLRLIWINDDGTGIAVFFIGLSLVAIGVGELTTGKTWCNYLCPVMFIEKIYTEPCGLQRTANSRCYPCTACKRVCPDIDQTKAYWKEIDLPSKRIAYFAYPGLVVGFYMCDSAAAGWFFLPWIPRAAAALVTLVASAGISWAIFARGVMPLVSWRLERNQLTSDKRSLALGIAAFTAFIAFYFFALQQAMPKSDWLLIPADLLTLCVATASLVRRLAAISPKRPIADPSFVPPRDHMFLPRESVRIGIARLRQR